MNQALYAHMNNKRKMKKKKEINPHKKKKVGDCQWFVRKEEGSYK
jgi:hypothetical protein